MDIQKLHLKIGPYEVFAIPTGIFGLDGGAMFGTVPKVLWEKTNPADGQNRIQMEARALLLRSADRNILIDTGNGKDFVEKYGEKLGPKFASLYGIEEGDTKATSLANSLVAAGLEVSDITDVILTHLHFDHAGGATAFRDGKVQAQFPRAQYYVQAANLSTAQTPNIREKASYLPANFEPLLQSGVLQTLDGAKTDLLPMISVGVSNGHTRGQQWVKISDGNTTVIYCGDVIPTSTHVRLPFVMGYDLEPLTLIEEKRAILEQAAAQNWYLYFEHDPYCDCAQVVQQGADFALKARYQLT
jgi:glyoxylase-like metal-dependent hydrolase (beta-lactamase superfamily II)